MCETLFEVDQMRWLDRRLDRWQDYESCSKLKACAEGNWQEYVNNDYFNCSELAARHSWFGARGRLTYVNEWLQKCRGHAQANKQTAQTNIAYTDKQIDSENEGIAAQ